VRKEFLQPTANQAANAGAGLTSDGSSIFMNVLPFISMNFMGIVPSGVGRCGAG